MVPFTGCAWSRGAAPEQPEAQADSAAVILPLPTTQLPSVDDLVWEVIVSDTLRDGVVSDFTDRYDEAQGYFTFRGNLRREAAFRGQVKGTPKEIVQCWKFTTAYSSTATSTGTWGGGQGWTGQSLYVEWSDGMMEKFMRESPGLLPDFGKNPTPADSSRFGQKEIISTSLCGQAYFIDFETGKPTREPLDVGNPIKGTPSLDPTLNGNLYVGQGIEAQPPIGLQAFNLFTHRRSFFQGRDSDAWRSWHAYDSSPLRVGDYLFWPAENGLIYKFFIAENGSVSLHSKLRYKVRGDSGAGVENSLCVYRNYGFFGDNHGDILCLDLSTLKPIWHYDNADDMDGSIVCEVETVTDSTGAVTEVPFLYAGSEVDRQGMRGTCHMVKLNGLTGEEVWHTRIACHKLLIGEKHFDGGLYCTPLLGDGDCKGMMFASICQSSSRPKSAEFCAFDTATGKILYTIPMERFAWNSPVGFYNEEGKMFVVTGDSAGNLYLFDAKEGKILFRQKLGNVFESSPVVIGNQFVVGSRGREIYKFELR